MPAASVTAATNNDKKTTTTTAWRNAIAEVEKMVKVNRFLCFLSLTRHRFIIYSLCEPASNGHA